MKKLSNKDFLELLLEDFGASSTSKKLALDTLQAFPVNFFVLEKDVCNLEQIDISLRLAREKNDFSLLCGKTTLNANNYPKWERVFSSINDINVKSKYSFVDQIWLEFDENNFDKLSNCIPGFYFNVLNFTPEKIHLIIELIFQLREGAVLTSLVDKIGNVLALLDSDCEFISVGIFSGRKNQPIRIGWLMPVLKAIELNKHYSIDDRIIDFLRAQRSFIHEKVIVHFNITETEVSFQGIELYSREHQKNWELVYESLVKHSLCEPKLKPKILAWNKTFFENTNITEEPLIKRGRKPVFYPEYFYCGISHFKLVNNEKINLKVYHCIDFIDKIDHREQKFMAKQNKK